MLGGFARPGRPPDSVALGPKALWYGALVLNPNRGRGVYVLRYEDGGVYDSQNSISECAPRPTPRAARGQHWQAAPP